MSFILIPVGVFCYWFQNLYMTSKRELVRLEAITRSPILTCVGDIIKGLPVIRAFKLQEFLRKKTVKLIMENFKNSLMIYSIDSWYQLRVVLFMLFIVQVPTFLLIIILFRSEFDPSRLAVILFSACEMIRCMLETITSQCNFESKLISFERCSHFKEIEPEENYHCFEKEYKK